MDMNKEFSISKVLISIYIEKVHRYVFDNIYNQDKKRTKMDKLIIVYYNFLFWILPDFRQYLKRWKPIIIKAYNIKKLSIVRQTFVFWKIRKINVFRYA